MAEIKMAMRDLNIKVVLKCWYFLKVVFRSALDTRQSSGVGT